MFQSNQIEFQRAIAAGTKSPERLRACWIGTRLARAAGMTAAEVEDVASAILFDSIEAEQFDLPEEVTRAIVHRDAHWDGTGKPAGLSGESIAPIGRVARVAFVAEEAFSTGGVKAAFAGIMEKASVEIDPRLADIFLRLAGSQLFWRSLGARNLNMKLISEKAA